MMYVDIFYGFVLCVCFLIEKEVNDGYEVEMGRVIIEIFEECGLDVLVVFGILF